MGQERRHFTDEFKREAVALLASSGRPLVQIASELGISPSMLRNWRHRSIGGHAGSARPPIAASAPPSVPDPAAEISRLRRENDRLRMERDILKNSSRGFVPPVAVETGDVSLAAERKRPSASWWR
jgi:transposase